LTAYAGDGSTLVFGFLQAPDVVVETAPTGTVVFTGSTHLINPGGSGSGGTTTVRGNLRVSGDTQFGTSMRLDGGTIRGDTSPLTISGANGFGTPKTISLASNGGMIDGSQPLTFNGVLSGSGPLTVTNGTVTFGGGPANTNTGLTTVSTGTLVLSKGIGTAALGGDVFVANGATLRTISANQFAAGAGVTVDSGGTFNLNGQRQTLGGLSGPAGGLVTLGSGTLTVTPNGDSTFGGAINGAGGVVVSGGTGAFSLTGTNGYSGGTTVSNGGTLKVSNTGALGSGGVALAGGTLANTGTNTNLMQAVSSSGTSALRNEGTGAFTVNTLAVNSGTLSAVGGSGGVAIGAGTVNGTLAAASGTTRINGNVSGSGTLRVENGATLSVGDANVGVAVQGVGASSSIVASGGSPVIASLGNASRFDGFSHEGTLDVGNNNVTLHSRGAAGLGVGTFLNGGTLSAANGVALGAGDSLSGTGTVSGKVAAGFGSVIVAENGWLTLGDSTSFAGFASDGELYTGANGVMLNDANAARLGSLTTLGSGSSAGSLDAANGLFVDFGSAMTGYGTVTVGSTVAGALVNNGTVAGDSFANPLTLNGYVKGVGTFDNVVFNGTFSPGLSPTLSMVSNIGFGSLATTVMELGGLVRGSMYDAIVASGILGLNGNLKVELINGFTPQAGQSFDLFDWGTLQGQFTSFDLPTLSGGQTWDTSQLYTTGAISVQPAAVPEPSSLVLLGLAGLGGGAGAWRRRRKAAA
jgi:hypothetical protein